MLSKIFNNTLKTGHINSLFGGGAIRKAYTLAEVVIVMLVVAVVVSVSIKITKTKLDHIVSYTYYSAFSTVRNVTGQMIADFSVNEDKKYLELPDGALSFLNKLFVQKAYAKSCYAEKDYDDTQKFCTDYQIVDACTVKNWNCNSHIGQYGITADMCSEGQAVPYGLWVSKGKSSYSANIYMISSTFQKLVDEGKLAGQSWVAWNNPPTCLNYWGSGEITGAGLSCHDTDMSQICDYHGVMLVTSTEIVPKNDEPDPTPNVCANQPTDAEIETKHCQGWEWKGYPTCQYERIVCPEGQHFSENACGCVPESATLPRKGQNFCEKFVEYSNTKSNSAECSGDKVTDTSKSFSEYEPDIILRNGMRLYNVRQNPDEIDVLQNNTQGASYEGVPNVNTYGYTIYIDIDGEKGASTLWEDVYPFYITMSGKVIPAYDTTAGAEETGGNSARHLMVSVQQEIVSGGARQILWHKKSVAYKDGACASNYISPATPYCSGVNLIPQCNDTINVCILKYVAPVKFFD